MLTLFFRSCPVAIVGISCLDAVAADTSSPGTSQMPAFIATLLAIAITVGAAAVILMLVRRVHKKRIDARFAEVSALVDAGDCLKAIQRIRDFKPQLWTQNEKLRWTDLELTAAFRAADLSTLCDLFYETPEWFFEREVASLVLGRAQVETDQPDAYAVLRKAWNDREQQERAWLTLDCDLLVREFRLADARQLIEREPDYMQDAPLLARVALSRLLENGEDADAAKLAENARNLEPRNPDVLSMVGLVMEQSGRWQEARDCFQSAFALAPGDVFIRDRYAEYCRRNGDYRAAIGLWKQGLAAPSMDFIWTKFLLWARLARPVKIDLREDAVPHGFLKPLIEFMLRLPANEFWDLRAFQEFEHYHPYLLTRQEVYWLRVLEALRTGREAPDAIALLNLDPAGRNSWQPELERALIWTIQYRQSGLLGLVGTTAELYRKMKLKNPYFEELRQVAAKEKELPPELEALLKSECAFSAACFAAGWHEAGLRLLPKRLPPECPDWVFKIAKEALQYHIKATTR